MGLILNAVGGSPCEDRGLIDVRWNMGFPDILTDWTRNDMIQDWVRRARHIQPEEIGK